MNTVEQIAEKAAKHWLGDKYQYHGEFLIKHFLSAINEATSAKDAEILRLTELLSKADSRIVAFKNWAEHKPTCGLFDGIGTVMRQGCTCGLVQLTKE